jgi:hypothetical protein
MTRPLDHVVVCVRDLEGSRQAWQALGFTATPRGVHPWGTSNHLVLFQGNFVELLALTADPRSLPAPGPGELGFAAFVGGLLARRQGLGMLVLKSEDTAADLKAWEAAGLRTWAPLSFSRAATLPDGGQARVAFALAFATDPRMPECVFFTCHHETPELVWRAEYQAHDNGALAITEVVMVAEDPPALRDFFLALVGPGSAIRSDGHLVVRAGGGRVTVMPPERFAARFPGAELPAGPASPHLAGLRVSVRDLDRVAALLTERGVPFRRWAWSIQVAPASASGVVLEFGPDGSVY